MKFYPRFDARLRPRFWNIRAGFVRLVVRCQSVAAIFQGDPKPTTAQNPTAAATWERANENLFSILFFTTERSDNNVVAKHIGKTREDGVGNWQAAWSALEEKYNSYTKET